jgi:LuxR family maltose regulon positive regulatory protein
MSASSPRADPPESAWTPDAVIRTKLQSPPLRADTLSRPALMARLDGVLTRPLALLSAPIGYGKTTLAAEWAAQCGRPTAWVTLEGRDNHLGRFGLNVVAALSTLEVPYDDGLVRAIHTSPPPAIDTLVARLVDLLTALPDEVVIVLDDYHTLTHPLLHSAVAMLIQHLPAHTHLVTLTRADPPLPLAQWRARDQLIELRAADLAFTPHESAEFLRRTLPVEVSSATTGTLIARTEGWPAGLHLAALALRAQPGSSTAESFNGSHRFVADYLSAQVLHQQPEPVQRFLLETAIVERMTAALCDELTRDWRAGPSQAVLDQLESANLFLVPLDDGRQWFRYQILFAEFLRARLRAAQPERVAELHRRAAAWYEQHGFVAEAGQAMRPADAERPSPKSKPPNLIEPLSERERDVLRLIAQGMTNQQIAAALVVAPSTVQTHVKHLYSKLHVHSRTQAVARARETGLIE